MKSFTRVLIVDDENMFRNILRNLIHWEDEGFLLVGFAENGQHALSLLDATAPQIVITDVAMPVMNGVELLGEIKKRNEQGGDHIESIVISGFDTFSYVRDAMKNGAFDYILKSELTAESLLQRLNNLVSCLPQPSRLNSRLELSQFFENLLNQTYSNRNYIHQEFLNYGIAIDMDKPLFLIRSFTSDKSEEFLQGSDARRILLNLLSGLPVAVVYYQGSCIVLGEISIIDTVLCQILEHADEYPALYWGVTRSFPILENPKKGFSCLTQIPFQFFYAPNRKVFFYNPDLKFSSTAVIDTSFVISSIERGDSQAVLRYLGDFLANCVQSSIDPYVVKKFCEQAIHTVVYAFEKSSMPSVSLNTRKIEFFKRIDLAVTIDELCDVLDGIFAEILASNSVEDINSDALVSVINQFVEENYMRPLRLSDVAEHVHVSYHHLSRLMNSYYKEPFNDYLNRFRIQAAQKLICSSTLPIGRVAEEVGFANQSYFGKVFKKLVGTSPRLYRLQVSAEKKTGSS